MKKKCLLIIPRSVFPIIGGYAMSHYNLMRILNKRYYLTLVVLSDSVLTEESARFYKSNSAELYYFKFGKWRYFFNALLAIFSLKPIQVKYYWFKKVNQEVSSLIEKNNILVGSLVRSMEYIKNVSSDKVVVFNMADSYALNYVNAINKTTSLIWKLIYTIEVKRLMKYERESVVRSDVSYLFNQNECNYWNKYGNVIRVPHGVNLALFTYEKEDIKYANSVVFIGKMDYQPNIEAAKWYIENVHSLIGDKVPLVIVGAKPSKAILELSKQYPNIEVTGFVEDAYLYVKSAMLIVAPMQTGSGIQNKVLEAMALSKTNIISTIAATPIIGGKDGVHFVIADTPEQYIHQILTLKENFDLCKKIGYNARLLILDNYTWDSYERYFIDGIEEKYLEKTQK